MSELKSEIVDSINAIDLAELKRKIDEDVARFQSEFDVEASDRLLAELRVELNRKLSTG